MVVDTVESEHHIDAQFITYLESPAYDGNFKYENMEFISQVLNQYRTMGEDDDDET